MDKKKIPLVSLFSGAGGLDMGFENQGFSLAGPRKLDDKRNVLYRYFVKLVEEKQPLAFVA